jgi:c-di-GMP-binding flagellar brake protein YcgR
MTQLNRNRTNLQYQREFFRVPYRSVVSISKDDETYINHSIIDLSGGGIAFLAHDEQFVIKDRVKGILYINRQPITFYAKVVRVSDDGIVSVKYILINEQQRCKIIQECMREQLKYRK